jgi:hypothetical protein
MRLREYLPSDLEALRAIHRGQGFAYQFPDFNDPLFLTRVILAEDPENTPDASAGIGTTGNVVGAAFLRLTAEAYLLLDPRAGTPRQRWQWLLTLHQAAQRDAWQRGLADVHAWLPPPIAQKFGKRIERLGWVRDDAWTPYCKQLSDTK